MLSRFRDWLFDGGGGPENVPERVRDAIRAQQERSEILSGWPGLTMPRFGFLRCTCGVREKSASYHKTVAKK